MFPVEAFERTIGKFVVIAKAIELPSHLTGGSISSADGEPRLTQDIETVEGFSKAATKRSRWTSEDKRLSYA